MGETASDIRQDIEQTRVRMTATIDAIGYKMDIPARMRYRFSHIVQDVEHVFTGKPGNGGEPGLIAIGEEKLSSVLHTAQSGLSEIKETIVDTVTPTRDTTTGESSTMGAISDTAETVKHTAVEATEQVKETARSTWSTVGSFTRENALPLSLGAFVVGMVAGMFIPRSRIEEERIAPLASEVKHKAVEAGEKVIEKGQQMAKETMDSMAGQQQKSGSGMGDQAGGGTGGQAGGTSAQQRTGEPVTVGQKPGRQGEPGIGSSR